MTCHLWQETCELLAACTPVLQERVNSVCQSPVYLSMFLKTVILHTLEVNRGSCDLVNTFDLVTSAATHPPGRLPGDLLLTKP